MREISLTRGMVALVDDEDYERVVAHGSWNAHVSAITSFYAVGWAGKGRHIGMHNFITGWPYVDHVSGDGLDNRRSNLRAATHAQNTANKRMSRANTSGFKGVTQRQLLGRFKWQAQIVVQRQNHYLGMFDTPEDAARAYDAAAIAAWGEFARPNFTQLQEITQ